VQARSELLHKGQLLCGGSH